ncbi:SIMPL domain-containing protein [Neobacillus sp. LXY-1]|uniref:SIMPL domain-containing protein n=1 Tax=Neobacillus sp. LXY-1 TaxID=3379133 RepID=UPI003EE3BB59
MYPYQQPQKNKPPEKPFDLKVNGEGELMVQPDSASVNLGVITESKELITAQEQNSQETAKVIQALTSSGIQKNHIQTFDYRIETDYDYDQGKQIFRGYKVTHILKVIFEDLNMIGKVIDQSVKNGVNYISNVQFTVKNKEAYYQRALVLAINNAIEKANTVAKTLHVMLNPTPVSIIESGASFQSPFRQPETMVKGISSTQIEPGQIQVKASILAEFHYRATQ